MPQLALPLHLAPVFSADNFWVSGCNQAAHQQVLSWPHWPSHALYLCGEAGSGKSHLAAIWAQCAQATKLTPDTLNPEHIHQHCLVEDIEQGYEERALFHLFNRSKEQGFNVLFTSALAPSALPFTLPDLTSRLRGCPLATIHAPDDEALAGALRKQFADRQLMVEEGVVAYIIPRIERQFSALHQLVNLLDQHALAEQKTITIPFVRRLMG